MLSGAGLKTEATKQMPERWREAEANQFAMALLMPGEMVRQEIEKMGGVDLLGDDIEQLADTFRVTPELMAMRIEQLRNRGMLDG